MPVTDFETLPLTFWFVHVPTVAMVGCPALRVDTPNRPRLDSTGPALLPDAVTPLACNRDRKNFRKQVFSFFSQKKSVMI